MNPGISRPSLGRTGKHLGGNVVQFPPRGNVVSLFDYRIQKSCRRSAKPAALISGYEFVSSHSELRSRQIQQLISYGEFLLRRYRT